jgi:hypothetical protein
LSRSFWARAPTTDVESATATLSHFMQFISNLL